MFGSIFRKIGKLIKNVLGEGSKVVATYLYNLHSNNCSIKLSYFPPNFLSNLKIETSRVQLLLPRNQSDTCQYSNRLTRPYPIEVFLNPFTNLGHGQ